MSDRIRHRLMEALLALLVVLAPSEVPTWRFEPRPRPAAILDVGAPVRSLAGWRERSGANEEIR